jgi:EAL domain-containing protein (putative c-di-GMP-specific phosphodiesterase class I)
MEWSKALYGDGFETFLNSGALRLRFQAIVYLPEGHLFGYESLSHGASGSLYESAELLFQHARDLDLIFDLESRCQSILLKNLRRTPDHYIFLNLEPVLLESDNFMNLPVFHSSNNIDRGVFVVELTERHHIKNLEMIKKNIKALRNMGFKIALDDVGSGYSDLDSIVEFLPDFIKISHKIIQDISTNAVKRKIVSLLQELAEVSSSFLVAEGIENYQDYRILRDMGVHFGQGYLLALPKPEMNYANRIHQFTEVQATGTDHLHAVYTNME